jgi:two-component system response regulator AtoC
MATAVMTAESVPTILIVNTSASMAQRVATAVLAEDYQIETADSTDDALARLRSFPMPNLVLMNVSSTSAEGLEGLRAARELQPTLKVIAMGSGDDARIAAKAVRSGAVDFMSEPIGEDELKMMLHEHLNEVPGAPETTLAPQPAVSASSEVSLPAAISTTDPPEVVELSEDVSFVCASPAMKEIHDQACLIAKFDMPVLMLGESGTGKEVVSLLIHHLSPRAKYPLLKVNCAAVPADLLESELFGYEAGAFTGATKSKPGKFEMCEHGTILLDEIGEMPPALQAKLLHFLQDHRFSRLGGRTTIQADVRILAATNVNIDEALANKSLREDLYYRLSGFTMNVPPLRERRREIPLLMKYFMKRNSVQFSSPERPFSQAMLEACLSYSWPGNLRQLENFVRRYLVLGNEELALSELRSAHRNNIEVRQPSVASQGLSGLKSLAKSVKKEAEAAAIVQALKHTNWHRQKASRLLKISYKALLYKIKEYDLHPPIMEE